jgi:tetratricopeptide (TPR) repeat protein
MTGMSKARRHNTDIPNNLPPTAEPFVDREQESARVLDALRDEYVPTTTIFGTGGVGKTALALRAAAQLLDAGEFRGGVVFLACRAANTLNDLLTTAEDVLLGGRRSSGDGVYVGASVRERVNAYLRANKCLLIFDGFDEMRDERDVLGFLSGLPQGTKALVTSRAQLSLHGREYVVTLTNLNQTAAVELSNVVARSADIRLSEEEAHAIADISEGNPLAVQLLSSQRSTKLGQQPLPSEADGTLEGALLQVYESLSDEARNALMSASIFNHSFTAEALAAVGGEEASWQAAVEELRRRALLGEEGGRFYLHPAVRLFALDRLDKSGARDRVETAAAIYYVGRVAPLVSEYETAVPEDLLEEVRAERVNFISSLEWMRRQNLSAQLVGYATMLGQLFRAAGDIHNQMIALEAALEAARESGRQQSEAIALHNLGIAYHAQGDRRRASKLYEKSLKLKGGEGNSPSRAATLHQLGTIAQAEGRYDEAKKLYEESLSISEEAGDDAGQGAALYQLANLAQDTGQYDEAVTAYEKLVAVGEAMGDEETASSARHGLATLYYARGQYAEAVRMFEGALASARRVGNKRRERYVMSNLGLTYGVMGELDRAREYFDQALAIARSTGDRADMAEMYSRLGNITALSGDLIEAERHFSQSLSAAREIEDRETQAVALSNLGSLAHRRGEISRAEEYYRESLKLASEIGSRDRSLVALSNLGSLEAERENFLEAQSLLSSALGLAQAIGNRRYIASIGVLLGEVAENLGDLDTAESRFNEAATAAEDVGEADTQARVLHGLSRMAAAKGDYRTSLNFAFHALSVLLSASLESEARPVIAHFIELRRVMGEEEFSKATHEIGLDDFAKILDDLAADAAQQETTPDRPEPPVSPRDHLLAAAARDEQEQQWAAAAESYQKALALFTPEEKEAQPARYADANFRLGFCLRNAGRLAEALETQATVFELFKKTGDLRRQAETFMELAQVHQAMNNYEVAWLHYLDAYRLYKRAEGGKGDKLGMATASEALGTLEFYARMLPQAVRDLEDARNLYTSLELPGRAAVVEGILNAARKALEERDAAARPAAG